MKNVYFHNKIANGLAQLWFGPKNFIHTAQPVKLTESDRQSDSYERTVLNYHPVEIRY